MIRALSLGLFTALVSVLAATASTTVSAAPFGGISATKTEPGSLRHSVHYRKKYHRHRKYRRHGRKHRRYRHRHHYGRRVVQAPFTRVETGRRVIVDAPFAHVYVGRGVHVRAPFVDLWVPRYRRRFY